MFSDILAEVSKDGKLLHMSAIATCALRQTSGLLSPASLRMAAASVDVSVEVASELTEVGLWNGPVDVHYEPMGSAYFIVDYMRLHHVAVQIIKGSRSTSEYRRWVMAVKERDGYECCECGGRENLHVHHIRPFSKYLSLRTDVNNGLTLCRACHEASHRAGG